MRDFSRFLFRLSEVFASFQEELGSPLAVARGRMLEVILGSLLQALNTPPGLAREKV